MSDARDRLVYQWLRALHDDGRWSPPALTYRTDATVRAMVAKVMDDCEAPFPGLHDDEFFAAKAALEDVSYKGQGLSRVIDCIWEPPLQPTVLPVQRRR